MVSVLADAALKTKPPPRVGVGKMVAPRANTTRMEDFEVQRKLGQGSFGVVYAVTRKRDLAKRRTFVIKQVELGPRRSEQEAAIDECRVLSKMDSKYVVKYFESFITKGSKLCIVMEYAPKVRFRRVRRDARQARASETRRTTFLQVAVFVFVFFSFPPRGTLFAAPARLAFGLSSSRSDDDDRLTAPHSFALATPCLRSPRACSFGTSHRRVTIFRVVVRLPTGHRARFDQTKRAARRLRGHGVAFNFAVRARFGAHPRLEDSASRREEREHLSRRQGRREDWRLGRREEFEKHKRPRRDVGGHAVLPLAGAVRPPAVRRQVRRLVTGRRAVRVVDW
jgi:hypothetical protein